MVLGLLGDLGFRVYDTLSSQSPSKSHGRSRSCSQAFGHAILCVVVGRVGCYRSPSVALADIYVSSLN